MKITLDVGVLAKGGQYIYKKGDKKYIFQLVTIEDVQEKKELLSSSHEEFPGFGSVTKFCDITDDDIEEAKKSITKTIEL